MITGITGIDDATVADAPPIEVVLPRFVDFAARLGARRAQRAVRPRASSTTSSGKQRGTFPRPGARHAAPGAQALPAAALLAQRPLLPLRHPGQARASRPAGRAGHGRAPPALPLVAGGAGHDTLEEVARFCEPGARRNYHKISLTETLPDHAGRVRDARRQGRALYIGKAENLRRRTRDHFLQRQAYHARQALELLERIDVVETGSEFALSCSSSGSSQGTGRRTTRTAPRPPATSTSSSAPRSTRASTPRPTCATTARTTPGRSARPAWPGASSSASTASTRCAPARTCRASRREHACPRAGTGACLSPCSRPLNGEYAAVAPTCAASSRDTATTSTGACGAPGRAGPGARVRAGGARCRTSARR